MSGEPVKPFPCLTTRSQWPIPTRGNPDPLLQFDDPGD